ncbi:MAG: proton-conducting transporter membrane subunit, partial [Herbiconiux sp.]|nr:proton-conducting transporter membrane subunit [Herbiconiux sp.]
ATGATIYYIVHHIMVQTALFLVVGLVERVGRSTSITQLGGLLKKAPFVAVLFLIGALNLGGIPPFSGFLGKVGLFEAGAESPSPLVYVLIGAGVVTSLLTLYALMRVWNMAFWRPREDVEGYQSPMIESLQESPEAVNGTATGVATAERTSPLMVGATTGLVALTLCLTVFAGPLFDLAQRAAGNVATPSNYVDSVFPGGAP